MTIDRGAPPPTRRDPALEANPELMGDATPVGRLVVFALAVGVILAAVLFGLNNQDVKVPNLAGTYGNCIVAGGGRGWWAFQCPDQAARSVAIDEFARRNSSYEVLGIVVQEKKR